NGPLHSGGVVDLDRQFGGTDARFTHRTVLGGAPLALTAGIAYDNQEERRKGFINSFGVQGALKRDEDDRVYNLDEYAQAEWRFLPRLTGTFGVRHSVVRFESMDHFITGTNRDDSGSVSYRATNPVAGVLFNLPPRVNVYANVGRGFETPTFAELAYKPDGTAGLNFALQPSTSNNYEIGVKSFLGSETRLNLALFRIDTNKEIVVASNSGGRSTFQNAGRTDRRGAELALESSFGGGFGAYLALAYVSAEYSEPFFACISAAPCTVQTRIPSGNKIPGVPRATAYGEISWREKPHGFETALEARWSDKIYVDDANSEAAPGYAVANWRAGFVQHNARWDISEFLRVDNLFDRRYFGSVIVN